MQTSAVFLEKGVSCRFRLQRFVGRWSNFLGNRLSCGAFVFCVLGTGSSYAALVAVSPNPECVPAPPGLIAFWPAEDNALDVVSGNTGALTGGVNFGNGRVGRAFQFAGN